MKEERDIFESWEKKLICVGGKSETQKTTKSRCASIDFYGADVT